MEGKALRDTLEIRLQGLKAVRTDYEEEWRDIARFAQPSRSRFMASEKDNGDKRRAFNKRLFDPHGIEAFRTLTNGMTSGLTSNSRPWFTLSLGNEEMAEQDGVRAWLSQVEAAMYSFLAKTNFYGAVKSGYGEMGLFGTEACVMVEHAREGAVCHSLTAGEYWIAQSDAMVPDTLYRMTPMSVRQAVMMFGNNVSQTVRRAYDRSSYHDLVDVYQAIEPNSDHNPDRFGSKPWRSVYWDSAAPSGELLAVNGFMEQPFWAPRWDVTGGDTYGTSPGMECLPALRELQMQSKRRNEAVDFLVKPEKILKAGIRLTGEPGRNVSASSFDKDSVLIPYQMPYQAVQVIDEAIGRQREQIDGLSFADLFNAITNMRGVQPRNVEEIASRNEEKLTQLGPVIERVSNEKLEVAIDRTFGIMMRGNLLPPVPSSLQGVQIDVEFVSILTQMQRAVGLGQIERTVGFVGNSAAVRPDIMDNFDWDETVREYASRAGMPAKTIVPERKVQDIRTQRAKQQQLEQAAQMMPAVKDGADAARLLADTQVGGRPMLDSMMGA